MKRVIALLSIFGLAVVAFADPQIGRPAPNFSGNLSAGRSALDPAKSDKLWCWNPNQPVANIIWAAYNWPQARMIFANPAPTDRYDFITTLVQGSREALKQELKNKLGLVGRTTN